MKLLYLIHTLCCFILSHTLFTCMLIINETKNCPSKFEKLDFRWESRTTAKGKIFSILLTHINCAPHSRSSEAKWGLWVTFMMGSIHHILLCIILQKRAHQTLSFYGGKKVIWGWNIMGVSEHWQNFRVNGFFTQTSLGGFEVSKTCCHVWFFLLCHYGCVQFLSNCEGKK